MLLARQIESGWHPGVLPSKAPSSRTSFPGLIKSPSATTAYPRNFEIFGEGEPAEYFYMVVSGAVRTYKMLVDGRRQICAFHLHGEVFGLEADQEYSSSAETITKSRILQIKRSALMEQAEHDKEVARQLWAVIGSQLKQVQARALFLIKSAKERVAEFLLEMAERAPTGGCVELPMSRRDIADYLGLTIETVSRTLTDFERTEVISLPNSRRVVLHSREALTRRAKAD
jgi:CRP/FNR family transcriptional regulator, nitrogen fixation regulation protein